MKRQNPFSLQGEDAVALFPFEWYRSMRQRTPVRYHANRQTWDVFRFAEVEQILTDRDTFLPVTADLNRQEALCSVLDTFFTGTTLQHVEMTIRSLVENLYEHLPTGTPVDLIEQLAVPLSLQAMASILGIPFTTWPLLRRWSDELETVETIQASPLPTGLATYFHALCEQRRKTPMEHDLISHLLAAQIDSRSLEEEDVLGCVAFLLGSGVQVTTHLIGNAFWLLDEHKNLTPRLREHVALIASFIEFVLLLRCPFPAMHKRATKAVVLAGQHIPANAVVTAWIGSANLDETRRSFPGLRLDPHRGIPNHLALTHDVHFSLKSPLTRLACRIALEVFCQRYRDHARMASLPLRRVGGNRYSALYGLERLVVRLREMYSDKWQYLN